MDNHRRVKPLVGPPAATPRPFHAVLKQHYENDVKGKPMEAAVDKVRVCRIKKQHDKTMEKIVMRIEGAGLDGAWRASLRALGLKEPIGQQPRSEMEKAASKLLSSSWVAVSMMRWSWMVKTAA